jgi:cyclopropane fatty-acyl-phospholipid synthase-like methyltransferase
MAIIQSKASNARGGLLSRLHDWWEGTETAPPDEFGPAETLELDAEETSDAGETMARVWTRDRITAVQLVCGEGNSTPVGERMAKQIVKPLGLNEQMSALVYGCQLGLFARVVARETGTWADGIDTEPLLVEEATRLSTLQGLSKKAAIRAGHLNDNTIKDGSRDAVIAVEALHRQPDLDAQLRGIHRVLKSTGQLLLVEFVRKPEADAGALEQWAAYEPAPPIVCTMDELRKAMKKARLVTRVTADITDDYATALTQGLQGMAKQLIKHPPESATHTALLREVHYWGRRLALLQAGHLGVVRIIGAQVKD